MKLRILFFAFLAGIATIAHGQTFNPARSYKPGTTEKHAMTLSMDTSAGAASVSMTMTNSVKKVYENGDADIETAVSEFTINVGGTEMKAPDGKPTTRRVTKYGLSSDTSKSRGGNFAHIGGYFGDKEMKLGQTVSF